MLHYSIYAWEDVFYEDDVNPKHEEYQTQNGHFLYEPLANGKVKIVRIISTNPQVYMEQKWQPGSILSLNDLD